MWLSFVARGFADQSRLEVGDLRVRVQGLGFEALGEALIKSPVNQTFF